MKWQEHINVSKKKPVAGVILVAFSIGLIDCIVSRKPCLSTMLEWLGF